MANQKELLSLSEHLRTRGLYEDTIPLYENDQIDALITRSDETLALAAGLYDKLEALKLVLKVRILKLQRESSFECVPAEVMVYRQAIVEIATIIDDVIKYRQEYERRTAAHNKEEGQVEGTPKN